MPDDTLNVIVKYIAKNAKLNRQLMAQDYQRIAQDEWFKPVVEQLETMSNSRLVSRALRYLQPTNGSDPATALSNEYKKNMIAILTMPRTLSSLPPSDVDSAFDALQSLPGFEEWKPQFEQLRERIRDWKQQGISLGQKRTELHTVIFSEDGKPVVEFARHYHAFLTAYGVFTPDDRLIRADGASDRAVDQAYSYGMCWIQNAEKLSPEATNKLSSRMQSQDVVIIASYTDKKERVPPKLFENRFSLRFSFLPQGAIVEILENMDSWLQERYGYPIELEAGSRGPHARMFANRVTKNKEKGKHEMKQRLNRALEAAANRRKARLERDTSDKAEWISKKDLLGEKLDITDYHTQPWKALNSMIGLDDVKASVDAFLSRRLLEYHRELHGGKPIRTGLSRLFIGPPGTGKTTVAQLYGKIISSLGLLQNGELVVKNASDFIGAYQGHSESQTKEIIEAARGKVLMIDEAYMLDPYRYGTPDAVDPFRQAAVDTMAGVFQNTADDNICIIMCGYKEPMERMLQKANPGLARRFPVADAFVFHDLDLPQLEKILDFKLREAEFTMTDEAKRVAMDVLKLAKQHPNFGNGGEIDNLLTRALANYASRYGGLRDEERMDLEGEVCFEPGDIDPGYKTRPQGQRSTTDKKSENGILSNNDMSSTFVYPDLPKGSYIRILQLQPAPNYEYPVECNLQKLCLEDGPDERPAFDAVSYVWGTQDRTRHIFCDGETISVTVNCELALRHLRSKDRLRTLWIDAICINQKSEEERNDQVLRMGDIFKTAVNMYIWLGTGSTKEQTALIRLQSKKDLQGDFQDFIALEAVMKNQWWTRMWTFQEFILAQRPIFVVGEVQIDWEDFYDIVHDLLFERDMGREVETRLFQYSKHAAINQLVPEDCENADQVKISTHMLPYMLELSDAYTCRQAYHERLKYSRNRIFMSHFLLKARNREATDPRDKIYGLHYLFEASGYKLPEPDYRKSVAEVYERAAFSLAQQDNSWWILAHLFSKEVVSNPQLPSWVPDFNTRSVWHQHLNLRIQNLNDLEESLERRQEAVAAQRAHDDFVLKEDGAGVVSKAVFLWSVTSATSGLPPNKTLDVSFDETFEMTAFEVLSNAMEDFKFQLADWLTSMEPSDDIQCSESSVNCATELPDQYQNFPEITHNKGHRLRLLSIHQQDIRFAGRGTGAGLGAGANLNGKSRGPSTAVYA